ncbi:MAG: phosphotransferase [Arthrospira sp. SH-MAG29]|nr:phosphotransferase [Arthrospira sp. SH-MAG29]MBS0014925.1 phosphotransferase [Arthrospira sp. SH-MAG29]
MIAVSRTRSKRSRLSLATTEETFPVSYSTLACEALVSKVLPQYRLEAVQSCEFWHRGLSDIYVIETSIRSYILRVSHHHWRSRSETEFELDLLDFLGKRDIPVSHPLRTWENQLLVEINAPEGKRYAALFTYASGQIPLGDLNPSQSRQLGQTVARLHQVSRHFHTDHYRSPLTLEYLLDRSVEAIAPFLQLRSSDLSDLHNTAETIRAKLADFPKNADLWGICWGDPHSGNAHFTHSGEITLFDFDQCGYGWRIFDIAKFLQVSLQAGLGRSSREAFIQGYQEIYPLTDWEKYTLPAFTQVAQIWSWAISLQSAKMYDYSRLNHGYFSRYLQQLKRLESKDWQPSF